VRTLLGLDEKPARRRVGRVRLIPMSDAFTLIKAAPVDPARVCAAFEAIATRI
jgi:hypothetical protein